MFVIFQYNFITNTNIIALIYPVSLYMYALIDNPIPKITYWKYMIGYSNLVIYIKLLY